jgi:hypothetical protein
MADLDFLYEIDAKLDGLLKMNQEVGKSIGALHKLDEATEHAGHASEHASRGHDKHAHSLINLGHQFEYAKNGLNEFAEAIGLVLAFEAVEKIVDKVKELGAEILGAAGKAERAEKSFKLLLGVQGGDELLEYLEDITKHTEFTNERLQGTAASLLRVGFAGEGLHRALAAALDIAALPGGNLEEALASLERLKRTGRVDNRTLGGIGFGENDFLKQLSARTGKPSDILKRDMEKGKLDVEEALESLYDLIHKRTGRALGAAGVEMSETLGARITHLRDAPEELYKTLSKTEAFDRLSGVIGKLGDMLNPSGEVGGKLAKSLEVLFTRAADLIEHIDFKAWGDRLIDFLDKLPQRLEDVEEVLSVFASVAKFLGGIVVDLGDELGRLAAVLFLAGEKVVEWVTGAYDTVVGVAERFFEAAAGIGKALWQGLKEGIAGGITAVLDTVSGLGDAVVGKLKGVLGIHSPSAVFAEMGEMSGEGYIRGLDRSADEIDAAVARSMSMADAVPAGAYPRPAGASGGFGPIQVTVHVETNVNATGHGGEGNAEQLGQQVAAHVESILPGALQSAFERMQLQAGSA